MSERTHVRLIWLCVGVMVACIAAEAAPSVHRAAFRLCEWLADAWACRAVKLFTFSALTLAPIGVAVKVLADLLEFERRIRKAELSRMLEGEL